MGRKSDRLVWCIAYINAKNLGVIERELRKVKSLGTITAFIPTVKILKKNFKNKEHFQEVPLLFNYGFFSMPLSVATNAESLKILKEKVTCIHAWVKDPAKVYETKPKLQEEGEGEDTVRVIPMKDEYSTRVAIATEEEIAAIVQAESDTSIYSKEDLSRVKEGQLIVLHGYPFEGLKARVVKIDSLKKSITVDIDSEIDSVMRSTVVSFDNVFWSVYHSDTNIDDDVANTPPSKRNKLITNYYNE
jgi:phage gp45-like